MIKEDGKVEDEKLQTENKDTEQPTQLTKPLKYFFTPIPSLVFDTSVKIRLPFCPLSKSQSQSNDVYHLNCYIINGPLKNIENNLCIRLKKINNNSNICNKTNILNLKQNTYF